MTDEENTQKKCCQGHCHEQKEDSCQDKADKSEKQDPKDKQIIELTNDLKRVAAEFENFRKRMDKQNEEYKLFAKKGVIIDLLNVADNFALALKNTKDHEQLVKGIEMIYGQFMGLLEEEGVIPINSKKYDSNLHEVLLTEKSDKEDYTILEELTKGYTMHGKVIRHAKVKIAKSN